ncbi:hypothetical protein LEP1GSC125_1628 [Leptospira mayottensis 200901122]|uniref:Uncharacterized protein n=2 Tax=Leptospira mayottensis TaxID=1137606 RepID=A0AA87SWA6_9LEPT|nr:hypothetical protein DQM28_10960 [Leptospira mayottensis]EKR99852.1 hypothetical protein LEP1GSC125_1628 [Leptospira mayottensis 200901122]
MNSNILICLFFEEVGYFSVVNPKKTIGKIHCFRFLNVTLLLFFVKDLVEKNSRNRGHANYFRVDDRLLKK